MKSGCSFTILSMYTRHSLAPNSDSKHGLNPPGRLQRGNGTHSLREFLSDSFESNQKEYLKQDTPFVAYSGETYLKKKPMGSERGKIDPKRG